MPFRPHSRSRGGHDTTSSPWALSCVEFPGRRCWGGCGALPDDARLGHPQWHQCDGGALSCFARCVGFVDPPAWNSGRQCVTVSVSVSFESVAVCAHSCVACTSSFCAFASNGRTGSARTSKRKEASTVDVHAESSVVDAPDAIKTHFATSYNHVSLRGAEPPSKAQVELSRRSQAKIGYTDVDLQIAGDDVVLMQGVGNPHLYARYNPGDTVLDLGCGMGVDTRIAASRVGERGRAVGIDLSEGEVLVAMGRAREHGVYNVDYRVGDMEQMPIADNSVDVVISNGVRDGYCVLVCAAVPRLCSQGFCLVPNKDKAFREIFRVLRPGGRISIACTVRRKLLDTSVRWPVCMHTFMLQADIDPVLGSIGFTDVAVDMNNSRMDAQAVTEDDIGQCPRVACATPVLLTLRVCARCACADAAAKAAGVCTHAIRAQLKRKKAHGVASDTSTATSDTTGNGDAKVGHKVTVHKGESQFKHLRNYNMSELCARVVIHAVKPASMPQRGMASPAQHWPYLVAVTALLGAGAFVWARATRK